MLSCFGMGIIENINMLSLYASTFVLGCVYNVIYHNLGSVGDHSGVYGNGMARSGNGTGACVASPTSGAALTWAVASCFKGA